MTDQYGNNVDGEVWVPSLPRNELIGEFKVQDRPNPDQFLEKAKRSVARVAARCEPEELYIVWFCKVLGNWKALISTDAVPGMYWEVTYNGAKKETYVDTYRKAFNDCIPD